MSDVKSREFVYHVYPKDDLRKHITDKEGCWCKPEHDEEELILIHNSMDKREDYENGRKKH